MHSCGATQVDVFWAATDLRFPSALKREVDPGGRPDTKNHVPHRCPKREKPYEN